MILTDEEIAKAWGYADFGGDDKRKVLYDALKKYALGYEAGHTIEQIAEELFLIGVSGKGKSRSIELTEKGVEFMEEHTAQMAKTKERERCVRIIEALGRGSNYLELIRREGYMEEANQPKETESHSKGERMTLGRTEEKKMMDWKDLVYINGKLDEKKVMDELSDYAFLMEQASLVYEHVAGLSKTNYTAETIISQHDEKCLSKGITQDDVKMMLEQCGDIGELKQSLITYFEISNDR